MHRLSYLLASSVAIVSSALVAQDQTIQQGTYVNDDDSAKWIFGSKTGSFVQYKSINGNPGIITIEFDYSISSDGKNLKLRQTQISLTGHPAGRTQALDKTLNEAIEIRSGAIVIGGVIYSRQ